jgi:hypothetical protein
MYNTSAAIFETSNTDASGNSLFNIIKLRVRLAVSLSLERQD